MTRHCHKCGTQIIDTNSVFCKTCGAKLLENRSEPLGSIPPAILQTGSNPPSKGKINNKPLPPIFWIFLIGSAIICILILLSVSGGSQSTPTPAPINPNAFRTAGPTTLPTPTIKSSPKFVRGDIVTDEQVTGSTDRLYTILSYDYSADEYHTTFIFRNNDGSWGHWTMLSWDLYFPRDKFEEGMWVYGNINPTQVPCGELNNDPDSVKFCTKK